MPLSAFKEALRPCTKNPSLNSQTCIKPRIPPKSSLSQQLLRLQDHPVSVPPFHLKSPNKETLFSPAVNDDDDEQELERTVKPKMEFDHAGPYELLPSSNSQTCINPRKPPKSSLSQQLLRLQDHPVSVPQFHFKSPKNETLLSPAVNDGDDEQELERTVRPRLEFDHAGPYEPLLLSLPEDAFAVQVPACINCRLLEHQRTGVKFLYDLYKNNHGGILGDDMGLGKTIQTIAFLAAVYRKDEEDSDIKSMTRKPPDKPVLIVCPSSVIQNWEDEFSKWATFSVAIYCRSNRDLVIDKLEAHRVEVLITSFDTYRIHGAILSNVQWEIMIVDEAHRLKNEKSKLYQACLEIKTLKRFGLTGTVMQNKITELFNLFDWVAPGCLGTRVHFREFYDEPLKHGQRSSAPERFIKVADERKQHLVAVLRKYLLRRIKEETIGHLMRGKEDNVVFCAMSDLQMRVYRRMLQLPDIQCLINKDLPCSCGSPLKQVECCNRLVPDGAIWPFLHRENPDGCDSCPFCLVLPCLVKLQQVSNHLELIRPNPRDDLDKERKDAEFAKAVFGSDIDLVEGNTQNGSFMGLSDVKHCGKMRALEKLMSSWLSQGDKVLLFSYSVRMLDILEKFLIRKGCCFSRLDGSTPTGLRQSLVDDFNSSPSKQVFLISTRAGGLGLNLVSANRVVIFDPNWNPAQDLQAQDRSFRFGQKRHVVVFRLLAAGSLEELVYTRQVYKQQLANIAVSGKKERRYFEGVQDCKNLQGELFGVCNLFRDLSDKLFISEIVELHEKEVTDRGNFDSAKQYATETGMCSLQCKETVQPSEKAPDHSTSTGESKKTVRVGFEDMGIVHAHRNEDIVNLRPEARGGKQLNLHIEDNAQVSGVRGIKRKTGAVGEDGNVENAGSSKMRKKSQYRAVAQVMGMGEVELSKWVLSASPDELEKLLQDYKRRKN